MCKPKAGGRVCAKHGKDASLDQYWKALQSMLEQLLQSHSERGITLGTRLMVPSSGVYEYDIAQEFLLEQLLQFLSLIVNV